MRAFVVEEPRSKALRALNYSPVMEKIRRTGSSASVPLASLVCDLGASYWSVFTRHDCAPEHGVELLTQTDMFASEPSGRVIRRDSMPKPDQHRVQKWQVLVAGAGQMGEGNLFGRSIIADGRLTHGYLGPHAAALTFREPGSVENLWAYAFLNTSVGLSAIKSAAFGTSVPGLRIDLLGELPIPTADSHTMARVATLIRKCVAGREQYLRDLRTARSLVDSLPEMQVANEMCSERRRQCILWEGPLPSLCAWNYAAGGGAVGLLRSRWQTTLGDVVERDGVFNGPRFARMDCTPPHGIDFLSQRDVFLMRPVGRRIARPSIPERMLFVPRDALLVGSHGQMNDGSIFGKVELASFAGWRSGVTQDILRVLLKDGNREVAYAFLSTGVGQWLLKSTAIGTSIPSMRVDLLKRLPFPDPDALPAGEIKRLVLKAEAARIGADEAESEAIRIIEQEVLPQWLA